MKQQKRKQDASTTIMINERKQKNSRHLKSYMLAFLAGLPFVLGTIILAILFIPKNLPYYIAVTLYFLLFSPLFIVFGYVLYRALAPVTGGMPFKKVKQWILLYPLIVGFGIFWALLSVVFEIFAPSLPTEYSETTLPILVIAGIVVLISLTRLRYPVARFINRLFGTEQAKVLSDDTSTPNS